MEPFHDVEVDPEAPKWRKVFQRGIQMRRNICQGKFELWRLYLTDKGSLPVKKMTKDTTFRELRYMVICFSMNVEWVECRRFVDFLNI